MKKLQLLALALPLLVLPHNGCAQEQVNVVGAETAGTISDLGQNTIVVRSETSSSPMRYSSTQSTSYVDDMGRPVSVETVRSGLPVTVHYTRDGNRLIADKVVVRKTTVTTTEGPATAEKQTRTTTTTETR
jgi:hypothetical protein